MTIYRLRWSNLDCDCLSMYDELCPTCQQEQLEQDIDHMIIKEEEDLYETYSNI